jgi:hypothetical protein
MNLPPWETHDRLCPNRRPTVAFPNSACSGCRAVVAARAEGYARGLIEGDHGGRREGYRSGYDAGRDAVMTDSYAQAVAVGQRDERDRIRTAMGKALFREDGRLHSVGSSVDAGGGIEFCCSCSSNYEAAAAILAVIDEGGK